MRIWCCFIKSSTFIDSSSYLTVALIWFLHVCSKKMGGLHLCLMHNLNFEVVIHFICSFIFFSFGNSLSLTTHQERAGVPLSLCFNIFSALNYFMPFYFDAFKYHIALIMAYKYLERNVRNDTELVNYKIF